MDALDVLTHKELVKAKYRPIFSADEHIIIGYELKGYLHLEDEIVNLHTFFSDETIPEEYRLEVEMLLLSNVLQDYIETNKNEILFIPQNPNLLLYDRDEQFLKSLLRFQESGLDLKNIVIQITENQFFGDINSLRHVFTYLKTYGIRIAIDQVGHESSNLKKINILSPDIIKMNISNVLSTDDDISYKDLLRSISLLAQKMGAILLYEQIESVHQMQYAWKNHGRYYEGSYLSDEVDSFIENTILKEKLKEELHSFIIFEKKKIHIVQEFAKEMQILSDDILSKYKYTNDNSLIEIAKKYQDKGFRLYVCDEDGFQISSNIFKIKNDNWEIQEKFRDKNWTWRPYFLTNMIKMRNSQKGRLSFLYIDNEMGENIRTYSVPLQDDTYLFIDLSYEFLYNNNLL